MVFNVSDKILSFYGKFPRPHRGRDRLIKFLEPRARRSWNGIRRYKRNGLILESDFSVDDVSWMLYSYGCLDYWDERILRRLVSLKSVCVDAGAHIGYYGLTLSTIVGQEGTVLCFEPNPRTFPFLQRNIALNKRANISAIQEALGDTESILHISGGDVRLGWSRVSENGQVPVQCVTLDGEVERAGLTRVDFIKIDVEGYEPKVLAGASKTILRFHPTIMMEINPDALAANRCTPEQLAETLKEFGYRLYTSSSRGLSLYDPKNDKRSFFNVFAISGQTP